MLNSLYHTLVVDAMKTYVGIADALGLESFILEDDAPLDSLKMSAGRGARKCRQRQAVMYKCWATGEQAEVIKALMKEDCAVALEYLKSNCLEVWIEGKRIKSWSFYPR